MYILKIYSNFKFSIIELILESCFRLGILITSSKGLEASSHQWLKPFSRVMDVCLTFNTFTISWYELSKFFEDAYVITIQNMKLM